MLTELEKKQLTAMFTFLNCWNRTEWLGIPALKNVFDIWMIQHVITELRPDFIADPTREDFAVTFNPGGWLKRIR